jgi:type IV secretion system protein VirB3
VVVASASPMDNEHDRTSVLFLALTRPAMIWGVPVEAFYANTFVTFMVGMCIAGFGERSLWRSPFMFWLAGIPIHLMIRRLISWDYHGFRTILLWLETTGLAGATLETLASRRARSGKDIPSSV